MARILVLDGHSSAALAFTRSAGRAGHWVAVGANQGLFAAAKLSRYCQLAFDYPVSTDDSDAFVAAILEFVRRHSIELVVPIADWTLQPLSEQRERFEGLCRMALPPRDAVAVASDKYRTVDLARNLGIAVPNTRLITTLAELASLGELSYPVVIKDRFSVRWRGGKASFGSVAYAFTPEQLERRVNEHLQALGEVLLQEFVSGTGIGVSFFIADGNVYLPFAWQRIREVDPRGSASSARKSIALEENLRESSAQLIRAIGFQGIAMVEYKIQPNGSAVLMEINGRPWGSIGLPIASGIDYPRYLTDWCLNGALPPTILPYRQITCRRLVGELTHLGNLRRGKPPDWPMKYPGFWGTLAKIAVPWTPGMRYDDVWLSDFRPGWAQLKNWFQVRRGK